MSAEQGEEEPTGRRRKRTKVGWNAKAGRRSMEAKSRWAHRVRMSGYILTLFITSIYTIINLLRFVKCQVNIKSLTYNHLGGLNGLSHL